MPAPAARARNAQRVQWRADGGLDSLTEDPLRLLARRRVVATQLTAVALLAACRHCCEQLYM